MFETRLTCCAENQMCYKTRQDKRQSVSSSDELVSQLFHSQLNCNTNTESFFLSVLYVLYEIYFHQPLY